jgi:SAM-dependent methyltransferase
MRAAGKVSCGGERPVHEGRTLGVQSTSDVPPLAELGGWSDQSHAGMTYDSAAIAAHFDQLGAREWDRFDRTLGDRVSLALHSRVLQRFAVKGGRALDIGAGPGRFTEQLHSLGCRIVVGDISAEQLRLNQEAARSRGFVGSIDAWHQMDICDLGRFSDGTFDTVVAFGGPLSYVFGSRDRALSECIRVLRPDGTLLLSVMSLWGTIHRHLRAVLTLPEANNRSIVATGDLTKESDPTSTHHCHMFRAAELRAFLDRPELTLEWLSASSALTTGLDSTVLVDESNWSLVLDLEAMACREAGSRDAGTHLIAAVRRRVDVVALAE